MPKYVVASYPTQNRGCGVLFLESVSPGERAADIRKGFGKDARTVVVTARDKEHAREKAVERGVCNPVRRRRRR